MKKFLLVAHNHSTKDRRFSLSKIVDDAWHAFILFTPIYSRFCRKVLGREFTIGHIPNIGTWDSSPIEGSGQQVNSKYTDTLDLIKLETGGLEEKFWPAPRVQGYQKSCSSCHGCNDDGTGSGDCDGGGTSGDA